MCSYKLDAQIFLVVYNRLHAEKVQRGVHVYLLRTKSMRVKHTGVVVVAAEEVRCWTGHVSLVSRI